MFGNTPSDRDSFAEAFPESPESVNVAVLICNLRNELEDKYQKQIEELKSKVDKFMGGAPNPNLNAVNNPPVKFEKWKPIDTKDIRKPEGFDGIKDFHTCYERFNDVLCNRNKDWKVVLDLFETRAEGCDTISDKDFAYEVGRILGETRPWEQRSFGGEYAHQLQAYLRSFSTSQCFD